MELPIFSRSGNSFFGGPGPEMARKAEIVGPLMDFSKFHVRHVLLNVVRFDAMAKIAFRAQSNRGTTSPARATFVSCLSEFSLSASFWRKFVVT